MIDDWLRLGAFLVIVGFAAYGAYRFDRDVLDPALVRRGARWLGITEADYRARRAEFARPPWRRRKGPR